MADQLPGNGFLGWLGRQVGHVKKAVKVDVKKPEQGALPAGAPVNPATPPPTEGPTGAIQPQVVYREEKVEEMEMPDRPGMVLRRTVIDEAIVDPSKRGMKEEG